MLFIRCTGTDLNTRELYRDDKLICNGLKCIFYHIFKKTLKQHDVNSHIYVCHSVSHRNERCRPCRILWPFMLTLLLDIFYSTTQKDTGKLKSFL